VETRTLDQLVEDLGVEHRAKEAVRKLMRHGPTATAALQRGLAHANPKVRIGCCVVLDHYLDAPAVTDLIDNLGHDDPRVRRWAMHALACDRCKEGECRPGEDDTVPMAIRMLSEDPDRHVRKEAAGLLGFQVHARTDALAALQVANDEDPDPLVRKVAGWHIPGGPRYERTKPRPARKAN
jgi:HEAT repeat protein